MRLSHAILVIVLSLYRRR